MKQDADKNETLTSGLRNRLFFRLYQCANMLHKTGTKALDQHGITTQQWAVLGALTDRHAEQGIPVGVLAAHLMVSRQNLKGVLSRLEAQGFVGLKVDANDNRSRLIQLTPLGRQTWLAMQKDIKAYYDAALGGFADGDLIHTLHYLDKLRENFRLIDSSK